MQVKNQTFLIGTSGWVYQDWKEKFYPPKLPQKQWLQYYAHYFHTVELNATFYRNFSKQVYENWYNISPPNFQFVIKMSQLVTHRKKLLDVEESIQAAEENALVLQDKLALILLQLPPNMPYSLERLESALSAFEDPARVVVEFRNDIWLTAPARELLKRFKAVFCNVDSPNMQIKQWLTSDIGYIRLHGRKGGYDYNYTKPQLQEIAYSAKNLVEKGAKKVYIFFNNDFHAYAPKNALTLIKLLTEN